MRQETHRLSFRSHGKGLLPVTRPVLEWVRQTGISTGLLTLWCPHTSCSLTAQENADPSVREDIVHYFERLVPEGKDLYRHMDEGPDDMPAHLRTMLTQSGLSIPVVEGAPSLGVWQGIYLFEHRRVPHHREIVLHLLGE